MKVVVLGAGALGSILAAHLAKAGEDVTLLARGERARLLRERGVTISGLSEINERVCVEDAPEAVSGGDLLIVTVKTYDTEAALAPLARARFESALSVQNGLAKDEQLAAVFGAQAVLGCTADFSGEVQADGAVRFTRNEGLYVGVLPRGTSARVEAITAMLNGAGVKTIASEDIQRVEWSKLAGWLSLSPLAVLSRLNTHRILLDPDLADLQVTLAHEAASLTNALGIEIDDLVAQAPAKSLTTLDRASAIALLHKVGAAMQSAGVTGHKMSVLQDLERGRRLEVDETLGYALGKASELGLTLPALEACYHVMKAQDRASVG